jgi:hypothetical protein
MARRKNLIDLLDELVPDVREAFLVSIRDIQQDVQIKIMIEALEAGDINAALRAINIGPEYFAPLEAKLREAYVTGGNFVTEGVKALATGQGATIVARFDGRNPRAENYLAQRAASLLTGPDNLIQQQIEMAREVLSQNMQDGVAPRRAALDLMGRISRATGRREGGLMGLADNQAQWLQTATGELRSGDSAQLRNYLTRQLRDRRLDTYVEQSIESGKPIPEKIVQRMSGRYSDRLLNYRGETIARTELHVSLHSAQDEALNQMVDAGKVRRQDITETWDSSEDSVTRKTHRDADKQPRDKVTGVFTVGGYSMKFPGDSSLMAPAEETINCRCRAVVSIDFLASLNNQGVDINPKPRYDLNVFQQARAYFNVKDLDR